MKNLSLIICLIIVFGLLGCETVKKGTTAAGSAVGKGTDVVGGLTEGGVDGYMGEEASEDNPFNR